MFSHAQTSCKAALVIFAKRNSHLRCISRRRLASSFASQPGPPKLPAKEQAEFERLQRQAAISGSYETDTADASASSRDSSRSSPAIESEKLDTERGDRLYRGAQPEFDGDTNPRTGEVGGPKNEPLRWGSAGDWSYNGKVTDF